MDPTKSFDHLDPKLKETYARVMGTNTIGSNNLSPNTTDPSAPIDPGLSATPTTFEPTPATDPNQLSSSPYNTDMSQTGTTNVGPNPGTGPAINSTDTNSMFSTPMSTPPAQDLNSPATTSFFSNPSPATVDPSAQTNDTNITAPIEPPVMPITPYAPVDPGAAQNPSPESFAQPLPSPSTVNQTGVHETSPLLKVLYIIGAVIFFAVYTVFWIKIFNLPFLF
jgi:hypothetical protein